MADQSPRIRKNPKTKAPAEEISSAMESLLAAKARKEAALAENAEIELALTKKHLVIRDDVTKTIFEESRNLRDRLHSLCTNIAPKLSNTSKADEVKKILKEAINDVLRAYIEELEQKL